MMIGDFTNEDDVKVALLLLDNIEDVVVVVAPVVEANIVATKRKKTVDASKSRRSALK